MIRLTEQDGPRLARLYAQGGDFAPDAFDPSQLADGFFWGVEAAGELMAAGGTHVAYAGESVAAIGNIYTHPAHRGRGYGRAVTAAVTQALVDQGYQTIALNVDQRNA
ncbi:GNAT family N-acetyltransferase, partial [Arthrospira platensis SPKY2]